MRGGAGNDTMAGEKHVWRSGDDVMHGGAGDDVMRGEK